MLTHNSNKLRYVKIFEKISIDDGGNSVYANDFHPTIMFLKYNNMVKYINGRTFDSKMKYLYDL